MTALRYTLRTSPGEPSGIGGGEWEIDATKIACNNITPPDEYGPPGVRLWVIGAEFGAMGAVWADSMQDALDELVDQGLAAGILIDEEDADDDSARFGNYGEPADLSYVWIAPVVLDEEQDAALIEAFAVAQADGSDKLG
jgi:hypothetical protein